MLRSGVVAIRGRWLSRILCYDISLSALVLLMQVFTDGLEVMSNMGAVVDSLFARVQNNLVQTM